MALMLGSRSLRSPVWTDGRISLCIQDGLSVLTGRRCVATWGSDVISIIDGVAFDILRDACGDDLRRLERYLRAIAWFEVRHSDSVRRHTHRTSTELEILQVLRDNGYFS